MKLALYFSFSFPTLADRPGIENSVCAYEIRLMRRQVDNSAQGRRKREIAPQLHIRTIPSLFLETRLPAQFSSPPPVAISNRVEIRYSSRSYRMRTNQWHLFGTYPENELPFLCTHRLRKSHDTIILNYIFLHVRLNGTTSSRIDVFEKGISKCLIIER